MKYSLFLKNLSKCPFCHIDKSLLLISYQTAFLTFALAPYSKHHLLIIPKRHIESLFDLNVEEHEEIEGLKRAGLLLLQKMGYKNITFLVREGKKIGKSIPHLHYHLIPKTLIGDLNYKGKDRKVLSEKEQKEIRQELLSNLNKD